MSLEALLDLTGRTALVTGGSRGLGLQIAEALGEYGAHVALTARRKDELDAACAHLDGQGVRAAGIACDMQDAKAIPAMVQQAIDVLGPIDILVNNAGTTWGADLVDHPLEAWLKVMNLNLTAMFVTTQEVGRRCMVPRRRGRIVNIASILGMIAGGERERPGTIGYNTSKGGVISFTRTVAAEWAQHNINVNAIAPGFFPTKMTKGLLEMMGDKAASKAPLNRVGGPEDLKGLAVLLASDAGAFITGQTVAVDGGATIV
jgi:gluconate 5-dehydrogenase